ncbi:MAG TPA: ABC transporter permease [Holophagaceae bacterium]|nr:ABC transporter permease [Holophagaceae bacterium]
MDPRDLWALVAANLLRNKLRGLLTMLGILIGVAAVVVMIGIGEGSRQASEDLIRGMGTNLLMVLPGSSAKSGGPVGLGAVATLTEGDAEAVRADLGETVAAATPVVRGSRPAVYGDSNWLVGMVLGVNADYPEITHWPLEAGRYFTAREVRSQAKVCVLGKTVETALFPGGEDPIGKTVRIGPLPCEVIGVLSRKGGGVHGDQDDTVHAPYTTAMRKILGRDHIQAIVASAADARSVGAAESEITTLLRQRHRLRPGEEDDFSVRRQDDWIRAAAQQSGIITSLLALAAAISLIVGGIGISNIMLVSVRERTQEIGLRRASGATRKNILAQFLLEAVLMSALGGLLGLGTAALVLGLLRRLGIAAILLAWAAVLGFGFSALVGVLAGLLPAVKAARLNIVEAIRFE